MKFHKIPYYVTPWFLMAGSSLTMGLLSFSGILAIWPILPLAIAGFVLSIAYEGEIYLQNIKGALKKLFKSNQLERQLAKTFLLEHGFPKTPGSDRPQFLKDYERQWHLLHRFEHKQLDPSSLERKRRVEKTLGDMEKWFAEQLFSDQEGKTSYQKELRAWLKKKKDDQLMSLMDEFQSKRNFRHVMYQVLMAFCAISAVFMGIGTSYLLVEAFAVIPWFAALPVAWLPVFIVPMAAIAGVAYGFLVYNAITDMIASEIVTKWLNKISQDLANPQQKWSGVGKVCVLTVMFLITLALSVCTAGTWWTVVKTTRPVFNWMSKIPSFIMLGLNPLILSLSTWAFNVENISETLEGAEPYIDAWLGEAPVSDESAVEATLPDDHCEGLWKGGVSVSFSSPDDEAKQKIVALKEIVLVRHAAQVVMWYCDINGQCKETPVNNPKIVELMKGYSKSGAIRNNLQLKEIKTHVLSIGLKTESWWQGVNPFRLFIDYGFNSLRRLLFLGHLIGIGATADQVPGISPVVPALLGAASEGVEDIHYFQLGMDTPHEHKHDTQSLLEERLGLNSGHDHGNDLPTQFLLAMFSPFYVLAACWDFLFNEDRDKFSSWSAFTAAFLNSWNKETGTEEEEVVDFDRMDSCCDTVAEITPLKDLPKPAFDITKKQPKARKIAVQAWPFEQAAYRLERHKEKYLQDVWVGGDIAEQQRAKLSNLQGVLHRQSDDAVLGIPSSVDGLIAGQLNDPDYNKHRFFLYEPSGKTETRQFLEELPARVAIAG